MKIKDLYHNQHGGVMIIIAIMLVVLLGFAALVIDVGYAYNVKRQMQTAADAGALAGAQELYLNPAGDIESTARTYVKNNYQKILNDEDIEVNIEGTKVRVLIDKEVPTFFAKVLGKEQLGVAVLGAADFRSYWERNPFIVSYDSANNALEFTGSTEFIINEDDNGWVHSNGGLETNSNVSKTGTGTLSGSSSGKLEDKVNLFASTKDNIDQEEPPLTTGNIESFLAGKNVNRIEGKLELSSGVTDWSSYDIVYINGDMELDDESTVKGNLIIVNGKVEFKNNAKSEIYGALYCLKGDSGIEFKDSTDVTIYGSVLSNEKIEFKGNTKINAVLNSEDLVPIYDGIGLVE